MKIRTLNETLELYARIMVELTTEEYKIAARELAKTDLFFLLTMLCRRKDMINEWCYDRVREVEADPNDHLDLWSRGHYKSTIITFGLTIQEILKDPNVTIGIFSNTRAIARKFVEQIKTELENNKLLIDLFPEILLADPNKYSKWSVESGLTVQRTANTKECTIECCGIIEGMPTGRHYQILVYDDVVTETSISTSEMAEKTLTQWELSLNLGYELSKYRYIGTRYSENDLYNTLIDRGVVTPRIRVGIDKNGNSLLWGNEFAKQRRADMGARTWAAQILQDPSGEGNSEFDVSWLKYYSITSGWNKFNRYILVDPASAKSKYADYTAIIVFGMGADNNYYIIDMIRDRLNLSERSKMVFDLVEQYRPIRVGYEKYGINTDIDHIKYMMEQEQFRFEIVPLGGTVVKKEDRIRKLVPLFEQGRLYLPYHKELEHKNYEGRVYYPVNNFLDEYDKFPFSVHDDLLDAMSRMVEPDMRVRIPNSEGSRGRVKQAVNYNVFARR